MNKSICLVGVFKKGSTNVPMAKSFTKHGFFVIPVNYRTIITTYGMEFFNQFMHHVMIKYEPYLTLFSKCNGVDPEIVSMCNKYSKTWLFFMDAKPILAANPEIIQHIKNSDISSCTASDMVEWFRSQGVKNCHHIVQGIDPDVFKPVEPEDKYKADISFLGTRTPERDKFKKALEDAGFNVKFSRGRIL